MTLYSPFGHAGWHENNKETLTLAINKYLKNTHPSPHSTRALICPHAGYTYCGTILASAMSQTQNQSIDSIIIISPSHTINLENQYAIPLADTMTTPIGKSMINHTLSTDFETPQCIKNNAIFEKEHGIWMMLPFTQHLHPNASIVPIIIGKPSKELVTHLASIIRAALTNTTLLIISSDFTHYGQAFNYTPFTTDIQNNIAKIDNTAFGFIENKDATGFWNWFHKTPTTICGRYAIAVLLECLTDEHVLSTQYTQSGKLNNDWGHSVSYRSVAFGKEA